MKPNSASHINHAKTKEKGMRIVGRDSPELEYGVPCLFQACRRRNQRNRHGAVGNSEEKQRQEGRCVTNIVKLEGSGSRTRKREKKTYPRAAVVRAPPRLAGKWSRRWRRDETRWRRWGRTEKSERQSKRREGSVFGDPRRRKSAAAPPEFEEQWRRREVELDRW